MRKLTLISTVLALVALVALPSTAAARHGQGGKAKSCKAAKASKHGHRAKARCVSVRSKAKRFARRAALTECRDERGQDVHAFVTKYGGASAANDTPGDETEDPGEVRHAFHNCLKEQVDASKDDFRSAVEQCLAERDQGREAFNQRYGTDGNDGHAFGNCVSDHVQAGPSENQGDQGDDEGDDEQGDEPDDEGGEVEHEHGDEPGDEHDD